jgi:hypothetical protein
MTRRQIHLKPQSSASVATREHQAHSRTPVLLTFFVRLPSVEAIGRWSPGALEYARALLLAALDRKEDARQSLQKVFLFPDRNLSHALAREARRVLRD